MLCRASGSTVWRPARYAQGAAKVALDGRDRFDDVRLFPTQLNVATTGCRFFWSSLCSRCSAVKFLRKQIEAVPAAPAYILTEPWVGYRFRDPADGDSASARAAENVE